MPYIKVRDCDIFYEDFGTGDPVLFLHSAYSRGIIAFCGQIQPFFHTYRCLMPDFRGHGRTRSVNKNWDTPTIAEDMACFLQALEIEKVHVIGYSLGGGVALHLASSYPWMVKSLIIIGCKGVADPAGADDYEPEALIRNRQYDFIQRMKVQNMDAHEGDWQHFLRQSAQDWRKYPDLSDDDWSRLKMPMFCIAGEHDPFVSEQDLINIQKRCP